MSIHLAIFAQSTFMTDRLNRQDARIIDRNSPHLVYLTQPKNTEDVTTAK